MLQTPHVEQHFMNANDQTHRAILKNIAHRVMLERGLLPDFSSEALTELGRLQVPATADGRPAEGPLGIRDMRNLLWASIDNDDSRDLDQLTVAAPATNDGVKILVAVADVDALARYDMAGVTAELVTVLDRLPSRGRPR